jgi:hypothetical protein
MIGISIANGSMTQLLPIASPDSSPGGSVRGLHYVVSPKTDHQDEKHFRTFFVGDLAAFSNAQNAEPSVDHD